MQGSRLMERSSASIAIVGSGGAGVITAGAVLIEAAAHAGLFGLLSRSVGAQIRGGETMALLRILALGNRQVEEGRITPATAAIKRLRDKKAA